MARFDLLYLKFPSFSRKILGYSIRLFPDALPVLLWYLKTVDDGEENKFRQNEGEKNICLVFTFQKQALTPAAQKAKANRAKTSLN